MCNLIFGCSVILIVPLFLIMICEMSDSQFILNSFYHTEQHKWWFYNYFKDPCFLERPK